MNNVLNLPIAAAALSLPALLLFAVLLGLDMGLVEAAAVTLGLFAAVLCLVHWIVVRAEGQLAYMGRQHLAELQRAEQMQEGLRRVQTLLDSLPDALLILDKNLRIIQINNAAYRRFGRDVTGQAVSVALRDPDLLQALTTAGADHHRATVSLVWPVGEVDQVFHVQIEPLAGLSDPDSTMAVILHDVTALHRSQKMKTDFVANASHELRTPLTALSGFIETLQGPARDDTAAQERFLVIMQEQTRRMITLVNDLLSLSGIESREHTPPDRALDVRPLMDLAATTAQQLAQKRQMQVKVTAPSPSPLLLGEADEMAQLLQNLLDNALKYGRESGTVTLSLAGVAADALPGVAQANPALVDGAVCLTCADDGDGITPEHLPRLTERFYRVDTKASRQMGGTGLGLAIVKHIINRHRGSLVFESTVGQGTTVRVYLPRAAEPISAVAG